MNESIHLIGGLLRHVYKYDPFKSIGRIRVILWTIAVIVSSIASGTFLLRQNDPHFVYRCQNVEYVK